MASTGVPGLKTVIVEAGISNWYDYYRDNGLVVKTATCWLKKPLAAKKTPVITTALNRKLQPFLGRPQLSKGSAQR
ncbi:MAG: Hypothetical protein AJITA_00608 [Acetilactobacillus jinshanensis]